MDIKPIRLIDIVDKALENKRNIHDQKIGLQKHLGGPRHFVPKPRNKKVKKTYPDMIGVDWGKPIMQHDLVFRIEQQMQFDFGQNLFTTSFGTEIKPVEPKYKLNKIKHINLIQQEDVEFIFNEFCKDKCNSLKKLGTGEFGKVYEYKDYAIKVFFSGMHGRVDNDYEKLEKLQNIPLYPKLYAYYPNNFMIVEKITGVTLHEYQDLEYPDQLKIISKINLIDALAKIQQYVKDTWKRHMDISDAHGGNVMVTTDGELKIIDVGHFYASDNKRNWASEKKMNDSLFKLFDIKFPTPNETLVT